MGWAPIAVRRVHEIMEQLLLGSNSNLADGERDMARAYQQYVRLDRLPRQGVSVCFGMADPPYMRDGRLRLSHVRFAHHYIFSRQ